MRYHNLNSPPDRTMAQIVQGLKADADSGNTGAHGTKHMGLTGDQLWYRPDGREISAREVDQALEEAQGRIDDATVGLEETQVRLDEAEAEVGKVSEDLTNVETVVIPAAVEKLEQADAAAQEQFTELDTRLNTFGDDPALSGMRQALADAQATATSASEAAVAADKAASAASEAALEAAGIAASKGRVIIQDTEPTGDDRQAANIWIKPAVDDPDTDITETATTYVYIAESNEWVPTTSDDLAQAAQNALDAREAAQQAQQRADTAISNAATAQSAAEAAQQTADKATTDAREAHNEAVAAAERAEALRTAGENLLTLGSFDSGTLEEIFSGIGTNNAIAWTELVTSTDAYSGTRYIRLTGDNGWNGSMFLEEVPVTPGHTYRVSVAARITPGMVVPSSSVGWPMYWFQQDGSTHNGNWPDLHYTRHMVDKLTSEWQVFTDDVTAEPGAAQLRSRLYGNATAILPGEGVDFDSIRVIDATELVAAEKAAQDAQARADEAYTEAASKLDESQVDAKITASANGKNSITRSTSDPSGDGVVEGDLWVQVDSAGDGFAQWYWDGNSWEPSRIKNEMMESLDVHKLQVTGDATMDSAVIDKLWVDGLVGKTATFNQLTIAGQGIAPPMTDESLWQLRDSQWVSNSHSGTGYAIQITPDTGGDAYGPIIPVTPGDSYRVTAHLGRIGSSRDTGGRYYIGVRGTDEDGNVTEYGPYAEAGEDSGGWGTEVGGEITIREGMHYARAYILLQEAEGTPHSSGHTTVYDLRIQPMTGTTLIEPGAVTTWNITFTEELSGEVANFMSTESKKLVVTEEALLNHATLIGQTVVDDINVQGNLIGTDGVFTGTVDFENVNVTGEALLAKISAGSIDAGLINGGSFTGKTFVGGSFEGGKFATSAEPFTDGGVQIDAQYGIRGWKSGSDRADPTFHLSPNDGTMAMTANAYFTDPGTSNGLVISPETAHSSAALFFGKNKDVGPDAAAVWRGTYTSGRDPLFLRGGNRSGVFVQNGLDVFGNIGAEGGSIGGVSFNSDTKDTTVLNDLGVLGSLSADSNMSLDGKLYYYGSGTTSRAANLARSPGGGPITEVTSSRRFKRNIADWNPDADRVLALQPRQWQHDDPRSDIDERWHVGFVAEEVDDLGLKPLVSYAGDGSGGWEPWALNYDRFAAAHQVVLQKHEAEIKELRERIALLESK